MRSSGMWGPRQGPFLPRSKFDAALRTRPGPGSGVNVLTLLASQYLRHPRAPLEQGDMGHCDLLSLQSRELALPPPRHQGAPLQHQPLPCYPAHLTFLLRGLGSHGGGGRSVCCRLLPPLQDPDPTLPTLVLWTARSWALWAVGSPP